MSKPVVHNPVGRLVGEHPKAVRLARVGWLAKGLVYVLAGALALVLAATAIGWAGSGSSTKEASPNGAIKEIAAHTGGPVLLLAVAGGMFLYALWRLVTALLPGSTDAKGWAKRIGFLVSAVIYTTLGVTAVALARTPTTTTDGNQTVQQKTTGILTHSYGQWLIGAVGVIVIVVGLYRMVLGLRSDVDNELSLGGLSAARRRWIERLGAVGEFGRGVGIGLIGFFLVRAAVTFRADEATGLDGVLRRMATFRWGDALVAVVGIGFVAYGLFCVLTFTHRRLEAP